jgi:hypothetical protein
LRRFHARVALLALNGDHVRFIPGGLAFTMVESGAAAISEGNGKIRSVRLLEAASSHALRIGPPSEWSLGVRFAVREKLDCGAVVWRHHARATFEPPAE